MMTAESPSIKDYMDSPSRAGTTLIKKLSNEKIYYQSSQNSVASKNSNLEERITPIMVENSSAERAATKNDDRLEEEELIKELG